MCHVNRPVFHAQGQTQRRSNNRRGSNKQKSYTVDFIKKTLMFWIHWNHQLISTTQLQSNKESTDHWWLSVKKTEANFLQNWLLAKQRRTQVVQGQWDRGGVFQRTDKYPLTSNILLAEFKLRRTARSNVSRPWFKKKKLKIEDAMAQKKLKILKEAATGSRDSRKDTTYYWGEGPTRKTSG